MNAFKPLNCLKIFLFISGILLAITTYSMRVQSVAIETMVNTLNTDHPRATWRLSSSYARRSFNPFTARVTLHDAHLANQHGFVLCARHLIISRRLFFPGEVFFKSSESTFALNPLGKIVYASRIKGYFRQKDHHFLLEGPDISLTSFRGYGAANASLSQFNIILRPSSGDAPGSIAWGVVLDAERGHLDILSKNTSPFKPYLDVHHIKLIIAATRGHSPQPSLYRPEGYDDFYVQEASANVDTLRCNVMGRLSNRFSGTLWAHCSGIRSFLKKWLSEELGDTLQKNQFANLSKFFYQRQKFVPDQLDIPLDMHRLAPYVR